MNILLYYLIIVNMITFLIYWTDKRRAKKGKWRISEKTLILLACAGGSLGALVSMLLFRHKTKHLKFMAGVPFILFVQILVCIFVVF